MARKRGSHFDGTHGLRTSQGSGRPRHVSAPQRCAPRHTPWRGDAANSLSSSTVPPLSVSRFACGLVQLSHAHSFSAETMNAQNARRVYMRTPAEPRPHNDRDKPDKPCRRHLRRTPVYRIKIEETIAGAASMHLSSPETRRCFAPTMTRTIAMLRPLCFTRWDEVFYFSGHRRSCMIQQAG